MSEAQRGHLSHAANGLSELDRLYTDPEQSS